MKEESKLIAHHLKTINLLTFEERKKLVKKYLNDKSYREIAKELDTPLSTIHGWATGRNTYRSIDPLRSIGTLNQKLKTVLTLLISIKLIDNTIGVGYMNDIKDEIRRIEKNE